MKAGRSSTGDCSTPNSGERDNLLRGRRRRRTSGAVFLALVTTVAHFGLALFAQLIPLAFLLGGEDGGHLSVDGVAGFPHPGHPLVPIQGLIVAQPLQGSDLLGEDGFDFLSLVVGQGQIGFQALQALLGALDKVRTVAATRSSGPAVRTSLSLLGLIRSRSGGGGRCRRRRRGGGGRRRGFARHQGKSREGGHREQMLFHIGETPKEGQSCTFPVATSLRGTKFK